MLILLLILKGEKGTQRPAILKWNYIIITILFKFVSTIRGIKSGQIVLRIMIC